MALTAVSSPSVGIDKARRVLVDRFKEAPELVDEAVLDYLVHVLADRSSPNADVLQLLTTFFVELSPKPLSAEDAREAARVLRTQLFGELLEDDDGGAYAKAPRRLVAPSRFGAGLSLGPGAAALRTKVGRAATDSGGNSNSTLDRSNEAARARDAAQMRRAKRSGGPLKHPLYAEENRPSVNSTTKAVQLGTKDVRIEGIDLSFGGTTLLEAATLQLSYGRRYGVIGRNGIGKSTLLKALDRRELPVSDSLDLLYVEQEVVGDERSALDVVLAADKEREELLAEEKTLSAALNGGDGDVGATNTRLQEVFKRLEVLNADAAESRASAILAGLGFSTENQHKPTRLFSGGWRMRIALACALFTEPTLLLLDEPTNHLDLYAVLWLSEYMQQWPHTLVVVSHDRDFLNSVCTDIVYIKDKKLHPYAGNYDTFERTRNSRMKDMARSAEAADMKAKHVQKFVDRFRYNAKRAAMVQSRIKLLSKMEEERVVLPSEEDQFAFRFPDPEKLAGTHGALVLQDVTFGYKLKDAEAPPKILFTELDCSINMDSRTVILGPNGAGKSTILKLLTRQIEPLSGTLKASPKLRVGYFSQHHVDQLVLWRTPLEHLHALFPQATPPELRSQLSRLGVSTDMTTRPINTLSGGQKSRLALAVMTYQRPHLLVLDEPTNHLDIETIDALVEALNEYQGGLVVVTHDARLISLVCDEIFVCEDGTLKQFRGDFNEYRAMLLKRLVKPQFKPKVDVNV